MVVNPQAPHPGDGEASYWKKEGVWQGLPFVMEVFSFAYQEEKPEGEVWVGLNFAPAYGDPFAELYMALAPRKGEFLHGYGLRGLRSLLKVNPDDPVTTAVHLACPRLPFKERSKTALALPDE